MNAGMTPNEIEIAKAIKNGSNDLENVLKKTAPYVINLCKKWCRPPLDPMDLSQESLLRISRNLNQYKNKSAFFSWVYTITYRTFLDEYKKISRRNSIAQPVELNDETISNAERNIDDEYDFDLIYESLEKLPDQMREILILIDIGQGSYSEVAEHLQMPIGTVRSRLARARIELKKLLLNNGTFSTPGIVKTGEDKK